MPVAQNQQYRAAQKRAAFARSTATRSHVGVRERASFERISCASFSKCSACLGWCSHMRMGFSFRLGTRWLRRHTHINTHTHTTTVKCQHDLISIIETRRYTRHMRTPSSLSSLASPWSLVCQYCCGVYNVPLVQNKPSSGRKVCEYKLEIMKPSSRNRNVIQSIGRTVRQRHFRDCRAY